MSDCSTQAMKPKERRTCGTCKNVNAVWLDCFHAANDSSYYMRSTKPDARACGHHVDDPDSLPRRHERLAQVAREMFVEYKRLFTSHVVAAGRIKTFTKFTSAGDFLDKLEALGVSVDDRA